MSELKIHCRFFEGEYCHPGCPNYESNKKDILRTAKDLGNDPECIASRIRVDPSLKIWARCQAQLKPDDFTQCSHTPIQ
ncbi:MAG TPA: hypothetical protein VI795_02440 [Patescibacteria group bacterium]|nr:hypothetical protein [Patescibacteria group bacterium]